MFKFFLTATIVASFSFLAPTTPASADGKAKLSLDEKAAKWANFDSNLDKSCLIERFKKMNPSNKPFGKEMGTKIAAPCWAQRWAQGAPITCVEKAYIANAGRILDVAGGQALIAKCRKT